jgi:hypothetical protein
MDPGRVSTDHSRIRAECAFLLSTEDPRWGFTLKATVSKLDRSFKDGYSD